MHNHTCIRISMSLNLQILKNFSSKNNNNQDFNVHVHCARFFAYGLLMNSHTFFKVAYT